MTDNNEFYSSDEILSILKSNRMPWDDRRKWKALLGLVQIKEFVPIIGIVAIGSIIKDILSKCRNEDINVKK